MPGKTRGGGGAKGRPGHSMDQNPTSNWQGVSDNPHQGRRSNPGNVEAGVGHTRGHNRPGTNTGGRGRDAAD